MKIKEHRDRITSKLKELQVFYPYTGTGSLLIDGGTKEEKRDSRVLLKNVTVSNIPQQNVWIYNNEFAQMPENQSVEQKNSFTSEGKKVEKSILLIREKDILIFMVELKRTLELKHFSESDRKSVINKLLNSINQIAIHLTINKEFNVFEDKKIYPICIFCYNYESTDFVSDEKTEFEGEAQPTNPLKSNQENESSSPKKIFKKNYIDGNLRAFTIPIEPLLFETTQIPILFYQNPNNTPTESFDIDFQDFFTKLRTT
jgi:hypothetical protein